jgi:hypothetical protein
LKSLWSLNQLFRELFVFSGLTAFSFRRIRGLRCSDQKSTPHGMPANAGIQPCVAEILDSRLRGNDKDRPRTIYLRRRPQNGLEPLA